MKNASKFGIDRHTTVMQFPSPCLLSNGLHNDKCYCVRMCGQFSKHSMLTLICNSGIYTTTHINMCLACSRVMLVSIFGDSDAFWGVFSPFASRSLSLGLTFPTKCEWRTKINGARSHFHGTDWDGRTFSI